MSKRGSSDKTLFIHPFNFFIIENINTITHHMNNNNALTAAYILHDFILWLDPEIKDALQKEIKTLKNIVRGKNAVQEGFVDELIDKVSLALHIAGYFTAAKWGVPTKTTTMGNLQQKIKEALEKKQSGNTA